MKPVLLEAPFATLSCLFVPNGTGAKGALHFNYLCVLQQTTTCDSLRMVTIACLHDHCFMCVHCMMISEIMGVVHMQKTVFF